MRLSRKRNLQLVDICNYVKVAPFLNSQLVSVETENDVERNIDVWKEKCGLLCERFRSTRMRQNGVIEIFS